MSYNLYETPSTWLPDDTVINAVQGIQYLAWRIGIDDKRSKSLWLIEPVVDSPTHPITYYLPVGYVVFVFTSDTTTYGHNRSILTKENIAALEEEFTLLVDDTTAAVVAGYR